VSIDEIIDYYSSSEEEGEERYIKDSPGTVDPTLEKHLETPGDFVETHGDFHLVDEFLPEDEWPGLIPGEKFEPPDDFIILDEFYPEELKVVALEEHLVLEPSVLATIDPNIESIPVSTLEIIPKFE